MENDALPNTQLVLGRVLANRYLVEELIEQTSAAASYRAYHLALDRPVLLRVLAARGGLTRGACVDALRRARAIARLSNPHLGRSVDVGIFGERWPFVVSLDGPGRSLAAELERSAALGFEGWLRIARPFAGALAAAHEAGVTHGALSLDQVWLETGVKPHLKLLGWGLAELPPARHERPGSGVFASASRQATFAGQKLRDVRALGGVLYQLATGKSLSWLASDVKAVLDSEFAGQGWVAERALAHEFALVLQRCLHLSPEGNYENASQAARDLERLVGSRVASNPAKLRPLPIRHVVAAPSPSRGRLPSEPKVIVRSG